MKLGLDIHGVLDSNKDFVTIAKSVYNRGGEVHILTGSSITEELIKTLLSYNNGEKYWDYLVSIQDSLLTITAPVGLNKFGRPYWDDELWDSFKGKYCAEHKIDLHYDNTEKYEKYFSTPFILYKNTIFVKNI